MFGFKIIIYFIFLLLFIVNAHLVRRPRQTDNIVPAKPPDKPLLEDTSSQEITSTSSPIDDEKEFIGKNDQIATDPKISDKIDSPNEVIADGRNLQDKIPEDNKTLTDESVGEENPDVPKKPDPESVLEPVEVPETSKTLPDESVDEESPDVPKKPEPVEVPETSKTLPDESVDEESPDVPKKPESVEVPETSKTLTDESVGEENPDVPKKPDPESVPEPVEVPETSKTLPDESVDEESPNVPKKPEPESVLEPSVEPIENSVNSTSSKHDRHNEKDCPKKGLWFQKEEVVIETTTEVMTSTQQTFDYEFMEADDSVEKVIHHYQNTCLYEEMKPIKFTCIGEPICAYLCCSFLLIMMIFNLAKNIKFYGCRKLFDLRLHGTSFPKRPELIVIICSTLPMIFVSLCRPMFLSLNYHHEMFIFHAGFPQLRAFFDYFTRSATLYHMIYWAYRMPIINLIWKIFMFTRLKIIAFKERKNDEMQFSSKKFRRGRRRRKKRRPGQQRQPKVKPTKVSVIGGVGKPNTRPTPGRKRHRKARKNQKQARNNQQLSPMDLYNFGGQNFWNSSGMMMDGGGMGGMNMGYFGAGGMMMGGDSSIFMNDFFDMDHGEGNADEEKALEDEIIIPEITREFIILCKRIIPGVIYGFSFIVNLPVLADFEQYYSDPNSYIKSRPKEQHIRRFLIYDIVFLMAIPMIAILIAFFYGIIKDVQLNGETKMRYSIKCYYVTFIVLNLPIFILYLVYLNMDIVPGYKFGTCLILALTVYHANFILKSTVHGTACNLICCSDNFFRSHTKLKKWLDDMTTPILVKQRRANEKMVDFKK